MPHQQQQGVKYFAPLVTIVCFGLLHTGGLIWVLSSLNTTVSHLSQELSTLRVTVEKGVEESYSTGDAVRDFSTVNRMIDSLTRRVEILEGKQQ